MFIILDESAIKKTGEDAEKKILEIGPDPTAPITRKGVLTSFLTGKPMEIPEQDIVSIWYLYHKNSVPIK